MLCATLTLSLVLDVKLTLRWCNAERYDMAEFHSKCGFQVYRVELFNSPSEILATVQKVFAWEFL